MAIKKEKVQTIDTKFVDLKNLLKSKTPSIFEREPAPAFAEGNLNKLVEEIVNLFN